MESNQAAGVTGCLVFLMQEYFIKKIRYIISVVSCEGNLKEYVKLQFLEDYDKWKRN